MSASGYPALRTIAMVYKVVARVVAALGAIATLVIAVKALDASSPLMGLAIAAGFAISTLVWAVILFSMAEMIRLQIDVKLNTRRIASAVVAILD